MGFIARMGTTVCLVVAFSCDALAPAEERPAQQQELERVKHEAEQVKKEIAELREKINSRSGGQAPSAEGTGAAPAAGAGSEPAPSGATEPSASAVPSASSLPPQGKPGEYSLELVRPIAEDCKSPSVMLAAVTTAASKAEDFVFSFPVQALYAHPTFVLSPRPSLDEPGEVAFEQVQHTPSMVRLIAYCADGKTCNELAAMYKGTVPTAKPELYCGKQWERGPTPAGFRNKKELERTARRKLEESAGSKCARIGICALRDNPLAPGNPSVECQREPSKFKFQCATKPTCEEVVACTRE